MGEDAIIRETFAKLTDEQRDDYLHQMMAYGMAAVHQTSDGAVRVLSQSESDPHLILFWRAREQETSVYGNG